MLQFSTIIRDVIVTENCLINLRRIGKISKLLQDSYITKSLVITSDVQNINLGNEVSERIANNQALHLQTADENHVEHCHCSSNYWL